MSENGLPKPPDHSRPLMVEDNRNRMKERYAAACIFAVTLPPILLANLWKARSDSYKRLVITLFFTVYGSVMILGRGDGFRHQMSVEYLYAYMSFPYFLEELWRVLTFQATETGVKDVYKHVTGYFFGALGIPKLFFPFIAAVYGYFFAGSLLHILRHFKLSRINYVLLGFVIALIFLRSFEGVYTVRTWTGMWILVYACLKFHEQRKLRYLLLMLVPPFVHHAYFLMAIPAWIVAAFGARPMLYAGLFCASIFTTFLPADLITDPLTQTERGATQVGAYYREEMDNDAMERFQTSRQSTNFYNAFRSSGLPRWAPTILILTLLASGIYFRNMTRYQKMIFSTGMLILTFSNLVWFISALHTRSMIVATMFVLAGFLMTRLDPRTEVCFRGLPPYYQWGLHLSLLLFVPWVMFQVSYAMDSMSLFLLAFPFIVWFDPELNMSLKQAINALLGRG